MELAQALDEYLSYLAVERGSSDNTVFAYGRDLARYVGWLAEKGVDDPEAVTRALVEEHIAALVEVGLAPSSVERAVSAIKGFHRFMVTDDICSAFPTSDLPLPAKPARLPDVISVEDAERLLDQPFPKTPAGLRDHAILEVLYGCGLRASELCGLDLRAVLLDEGLVRVFGKGEKERVVPILGAAVSALEDYLDRGRGALVGRRPCDAIFLNARGGRLSRQSVHAGCTPTPCDTASRRTCLRGAPTCAWCRSSSATPTLRRRSSTPTSTAPTCGACTSPRTLEPSSD